MDHDLSSKFTLLSLIGSKINEFFILKGKLEAELAKTKIETALKDEIKAFQKTIHDLLNKIVMGSNDPKQSKRLTDFITAIKENIILVDSKSTNKAGESSKPNEVISELNQKLVGVRMGLTHLIKELKTLLLQFDSSPESDSPDNYSSSDSPSNTEYDQLFQKLERFSLSKIELEKRIAKIKMLREIKDYRDAFANKMQVELKEMTFPKEIVANLETLENALSDVNSKIHKVKSEIDGELQRANENIEDIPELESE